LGILGGVLGFWLISTMGRPWKLFVRGPATSNFYDVQMHRLLAGHLSMPPAVVGIEGFVTDHGTHMYFGLGPALMRLPFAIFGTWADGRLTLVSQLVAVVVLGWASARLLRRAEQSMGVDMVAPSALISWPYVWMAAAPTLASPILFLASRSVVYHESELWGAAAGLAGLELVLAWWVEPTRRRLLIAAAVAAFALSARPSSGVAPVLALAGFGVVLAARRHWRRAASVATASALAAASYALVNAARFGVLFGAPVDRQVMTLLDPARMAVLDANGGTYFRFAFVPTTITRYLLPVPGMLRPTRLFPFITWGPPARPVGGVVFGSITGSGSLPVAAPMLALFAAIGMVVILRRRAFRPWQVAAVAAIVSTIPTFIIAVIAHRYLADLMPLLVLLAAPGTWVGLQWWHRRRPRGRRVAAAGAVVVSLAALLGQSAVTVSAHALQIVPDPVERRAFVRLQYDIDRRLHDGPPPHVRLLDALPSTDRSSGDVVIVGSCAASYRFDGGLWFALDRASGGGRRIVVVPDSATRAGLGREPVVIAEGNGWTIEAQPTADSHHVVIAYLGGPRPAVSAPLRIDEAVRFDIVADPETYEMEVRHRGRLVLSDWLVPTAGLEPAEGWTVHPDVPVLCVELASRASAG
jgi:hypothetical protein